MEEKRALASELARLRKESPGATDIALMRIAVGTLPPDRMRNVTTVGQVADIIAMANQLKNEAELNTTGRLQTAMPVPLKPAKPTAESSKGVIPEIQAVLKALPEPGNWWKSLRTVTAGLATIVESEEWRTKHKEKA